MMILRRRKHPGCHPCGWAVGQLTRSFHGRGPGGWLARPISPLLLLCVVFVTVSSSLAAADPFVGSVKTIVGSPEIVRGSDILPATMGMHLSEKDILKTDGSSRMGIILRDGTRIALGPGSEVSVESFLFDPARDQLGLVLRVLRGVVAFVSGKIAQLSPEAAKVETPVGVIGLRGTKFAVALGID